MSEERHPLEKNMLITFKVMSKDKTDIISRTITVPVSIIEAGGLAYLGGSLSQSAIDVARQAGLDVPFTGGSK